MLGTGFASKKHPWRICRYRAPDNGFLSQKFPNKAATVGGHVQSHLCNVLKKMFEDHVRSTNRRNLRKSALHFTILCVFTKSDVSFFKLIAALYFGAYFNPVQTKK